MLMKTMAYKDRTHIENHHWKMEYLFLLTSINFWIYEVEALLCWLLLLLLVLVLFELLWCQKPPSYAGLCSNNSWHHLQFFLEVYRQSVTTCVTKNNQFSVELIKASIHFFLSKQNWRGTGNRAWFGQRC